MFPKDGGLAQSPLPVLESVREAGAALVRKALRWEPAHVKPVLALVRALLDRVAHDARYE